MSLDISCSRRRPVYRREIKPFPAPGSQNSWPTLCYRLQGNITICDLSSRLFISAIKLLYREETMI